MQHHELSENVHHHQIAEKESKALSCCSYGKETIARGLHGARQFALSNPLHDLML